MTNHYFSFAMNGQTRNIDVGYDRPLNYFYINIYAPNLLNDQQDVYISLHDPRWDNPDRAHLRGGLSLDEVEQLFFEQCITPPPGLLDALREDAALQRGNGKTYW